MMAWKGIDESMLDGQPRNGITSALYSGTNVALLHAARDTYQFTTNIWMTFRQARSIGANVKQGSHGFQITRVVGKRNASYQDEDGRMRRARQGIIQITVFNLDQIENLPEALVIDNA